MDASTMEQFLAKLNISLKAKLKDEGEALMSQGIARNRLTVFRHYHQLEVLGDGVDTVLRSLKEVQVHKDVVPTPKESLLAFSIIIKKTTGAVEQVLSQLIKSHEDDTPTPLPDNFAMQEELVKQVIMESFTSITMTATSRLNDILSLSSTSANSIRNIATKV